MSPPDILSFYLTNRNSPAEAGSAITKSELEVGVEASAGLGYEVSG
ncbi:MAG: hypothetical protein OES12_04910 [Anaerolineae bacterium]|nr:hypothetical protein [Anaerolineae bacterium]